MTLGLGYYVTEKGYLRYSAGPKRGKYVHRAVMEGVIGGPIPEGMTVEHLDHDRQHNCRQNLMLLDKAIHDYISWQSWSRKRALEEGAPDWVMAEGAAA